MSLERIFIDGTIVVATQPQFAGCGKTIIHKGSICKIKNGSPDYASEIELWKSLKREEKDNYTEVKQSFLREATTEEIKMYNAGVRNIYIS
jgi:hypothetical protein